MDFLSAQEDRLHVPTRFMSAQGVHAELPVEILKSQADRLEVPPAPLADQRIRRDVPMDSLSSHEARWQPRTEFVSRQGDRRALRPAERQGSPEPPGSNTTRIPA